MAVINTGSIARLLQDGVQKIFGGEYDSYEKQYTQMYEIVKSDKAFEQDVQVSGFGLARVKPEGSGIVYDTMSEGYIPNYTNVTYANGFIVTKEAMNDNRYNMFSKGAKKLAFSMNQTIETIAAAVYNRAFNPSYTMVGGDGQPLLSTSHVLGPQDSNTGSNTLLIPAALSETAIETLMTQIEQTVDERGLIIKLMSKKLIVPSALRWDSDRILKSVLQNDTAQNAVNALKNTGRLTDYMVCNFLTSTTAWFISTNCIEGMKFQNRQDVEFERDMDFGTSNYRFKAEMRFIPGWSNWRGLFGSGGV